MTAPVAVLELLDKLDELDAELLVAYEADNVAVVLRLAPAFENVAGRLARALRADIAWGTADDERQAHAAYDRGALLAEAERAGRLEALEALEALEPEVVEADLDDEDQAPAMVLSEAERDELLERLDQAEAPLVVADDYRPVCASCGRVAGDDPWMTPDLCGACTAAPR